MAAPNFFWRASVAWPARRILRSRRNLGYRLFPQISQPPLRLEPPQTRAAR